MDNVIAQFRENMSHVHNLGGIYKAVISLTTPAVDASDLLRAQYVLGVSALDHYVHELTRVGMVMIFAGTRLATPAYYRFRISMDSVVNSASASELQARFESEVRTQHNYLAFQHPDKIADAIRLISKKKLWECVSTRMTMDKDDIKIRLMLIVDRRNKIAHEADIDPGHPGTGTRWPISQHDVDESLKFIEELCECIHTQIA
jgi:hypothetical protein